MWRAARRALRTSEGAQATLAEWPGLVQRHFAAMPATVPSQPSYYEHNTAPDDVVSARQSSGEGASTSGRTSSGMPADVSQNTPHRRKRLDLSSVPMFDTKVTCHSAPAEPVAMPWQDALDAVGPAASAGTLVDNFRRMQTYLRISLTEKCNLRCQYCMPADGVELTPSQELLTTDEILRLARLFVQEGITKIRLTGGEPTVHRDLVDITSRLSPLPGLRTLAMTTNGIALARQLPSLRAGGMSALNISLDTLREDRFVELTRRKGCARVLSAIHEAVAHGFQVKVNVVLMRGVNDDELLDFVELARRLPVNVRFIEYMPFDDNAWSQSKMFTYNEMVQLIESAVGPMTRAADPRGEVAKNFSLPGFAGSLAFITSMTEHFCSDCNRLRLMADGNLKVCLFGANEVSLRDAMRGGATDAQLQRIISAAVKRKRFAHADMDVLAATKNRAMIKIGG